MKRVGIKNPHLNSGEGKNGYKDDNCENKDCQDGNSADDHSHQDDNDQSREENQAAKGRCLPREVS
jgi:hypothetical protein